MNRLRFALIILVLILNGTTLMAADGAFYDWWISLWMPDLAATDTLPGTGLSLFPSLESPLGGRFEGMGTAAAALATDAGFLEANPAVSARLSNTELLVTHHGWIADSSIEGVVYSVRFDDLGLGFSGKFLYLPFTEYTEWGDRSASGTISETVATANVSYNFFSTYRFYGIAAGANVKVAYRSVPAVIAPGQSLLALMADFGLQTSFNFLKFFASRSRNVSVGVVLRNLGLATSLGGTQLAPEEQLPLTLSAGLAYAPARPITLAADVNVPLSLDPTVAARMLDLAFGADIVVTEFLSLQGGVHLKPGNPRVSLGTNVALKGVGITANYNLDLTARIADPVDLFSVQARFDLGDRGRGALEREVERLYKDGLMEFAQGNLARAIDLWQRALELDPQYAPARDGIDAAQGTLDNQVRATQGPGL